MILREWRGRAPLDRVDVYPKHFHHIVVPELHGVSGFLGADLVRRELDGAIEYIVLSRWASMDAIHAFAGDDPGRAVVEPGAVSALMDYDERVQHYEIVQSVESA